MRKKNGSQHVIAATLRADGFDSRRASATARGLVARADRRPGEVIVRELDGHTVMVQLYRQGFSGVR